MLFFFVDIDDADFGRSIAARVQAELAPLQNLGARINAAVERDLKPLRSMNLHNNYGSSRQLFSSGFGGKLLENNFRSHIHINFFVAFESRVS